MSNLDPEIELIDQSIFIPCGMEITNLEPEVESRTYLAHSFQLNGQQVNFRKAKITPTKVGQFVAIWKRNNEGITQAYHILDKFEWLIIATRKNEKFGVFIFPKAVLQQHKIVSDGDVEGKRGIRVYPSWDLTTNKQARKTQVWQNQYFIEIAADLEVDLEKLRLFFRDC